MYLQPITLQQLPLDQLHDSPLNPRKRFDLRRIDDAASSLIGVHGEEG